VLSPGFMLDDALWDDFVPMLPADCAVQRSTLPRGRTVHEVADAFANQLDRPAMVLGVSMGGYVARALAAAHPQLIDALALVATSAREQGLRRSRQIWPAGESSTVSAAARSSDR
jgi:pimeloyl-ACP methyl ester carboxylesterase